MSLDLLLKKYHSYLKSKALFYSRRGFEYSDIYNQGYLILLETYQKFPSAFPKEIKKAINSGLVHYYRKDIKERHIQYGLNPEDINI